MLYKNDYVERMLPIWKKNTYLLSKSDFMLKLSTLGHEFKCMYEAQKR